MQLDVAATHLRSKGSYVEALSVRTYNGVFQRLHACSRIAASINEEQKNNTLFLVYGTRTYHETAALRA